MRLKDLMRVDRTLLTVHQSHIIGISLCYEHLTSEKTSRNQETCQTEKAETKNQQDTEVTGILEMHPRTASL